MFHLLDLYKKKVFNKAVEGKRIDKVSTGDLVSVTLINKDDPAQRRSTFEGRCIGVKKSHGMPGYSIIVWKVAKSGFGIQRTIPVDSPAVEEVVLKGKGEVGRSKLYHLKGLRGKSARIKTQTVLDEETRQLNARKKEASAAKRRERFEKKQAKEEKVSAKK